MNIDAEKNVLGSILMNNDSIYDIYDMIKPEMFSYPFYQDVYREMLYLYDNMKPITLQALAQKLEDRERSLEFVSNELTSICMNCATSAHIKGYAEVVVNDYKSREVNALLSHIDISPKNINNTISDLMTILERLQQNREVVSKTLSQIVMENEGKYFKEDVPKSDLKTGFLKLDEAMGGLEPGDVTIIAARPACGKSAFATQIVENMAKEGKKVGYFNLEMRESQIYERFIAHSEIDLTRLKRAKTFLCEEQDQFEKKNREIEKYNVTVISNCFTIRDIRAESRHQNYDAIVIDYMQLIESEKNHATRAEEVGSISREIKKLAMELNVHIIVLSQLNRASESRQDKEPTMSELRESGSIEQDASNVILIWNLTKDNGKYKGVKVDKSRQSTTIKVGMMFRGEHMLFEERQEEFWKFEKRAKDSEKSSSRISEDELMEGW